MASEREMIFTTAIRDAAPRLDRRLAALQQRLRDDRASLRLHTGRLHVLPLTLSIRVPATSPLAWLQNQPRNHRYYWQARDGRLELAGSGAAVTVVSTEPGAVADAYRQIAEIQQAAADDELWFLGGQAFDPEAPLDSVWSNFPVLSFAVPEVLLVRRDDACTVTCAVPVKRDTTLDVVHARFEQLLAGLDLRIAEVGDFRPAGIRSRTDLPDPDSWREQVDRALTSIGAGDLDKIVLTRRSDLLLEQTIDPVACLRSLTGSNPNCFGFLVETVPGSVFLGVSPERLFRLDRGRLETEAVAGTALRDNSAPDAGTAGDSLLACEKNRREHEFVRQFIVRQLATLCRRVDTPVQRSLLRLSNVSHIAAQFSGELAPDRNLFDVVSRLHPTPAVCGTAPGAALATIRHEESYARGWYTGVVGLIGREFAELAVAIRSAVFAGQRVSLFAGAGIVPGSQARQEWRELEAKIRPFLETLAGSTKSGLQA